MNTNKYGYSDVMNINCNVNFSLDTSIFPNGIIPDIYEMYFRVPVLPNINITVTLTTNVVSDGNLDFTFMFCLYSTRPDDEAVKETHCAHHVNEERFSNVYKYTIKTLNNTSYLSMSIRNIVGDLEYLNLYIDSGEKEEKNFGKINLIHLYIYIVLLLILI